MGMSAMSVYSSFNISEGVSIVWFMKQKMRRNQSFLLSSANVLWSGAIVALDLSGYHSCTCIAASVVLMVSVGIITWFGLFFKCCLKWGGLVQAIKAETLHLGVFYSVFWPKIAVWVVLLSSSAAIMYWSFSEALLKKTWYCIPWRNVCLLFVTCFCNLSNEESLV